MLMSILLRLLVFSIFGVIRSSKVPSELEIQGIEPNAGPDYGETRVIVRLKEFDISLVNEYPHPKCRFGGHKNTVNATYIACTPLPRKVMDREPLKQELNETCIVCENSPEHLPDYVPFTISLLGDFTDVKNSIPYRYYKDPTITYIYPRYGPKDGGTFVEVYGENFLNYDQNLRCGFGSRNTKAYYVSDTYLICYAPKSDVVGQMLPFTVSLNNQQNTLQNIPYVYYNKPQVFRLEPNRGPDTGGSIVRIRGQNFNPMLSLPTMNNFNDTFCKFGNLSLTNAKVLSSTEMECVSPPSYEDRYVPVEIILNNREWTNDNILFFYYHPPFIYYISPKIGPISGGTVVTITGSNFENTGYVMCLFGDKYSTGEYVNENELRCTSPQVEKPAIVGLAVAIRPDEFSSGMNTKYKYYSTPILESIEPICGPERGFTQISIYGTNFPVEDTEVKCVFNRQIYTNATVMNDHEIKCDSPAVLNYNGVNENNITEYDVEITLNHVDIDGPKQKFYYYKETYITGLTPILGPVEGNTDVKISGFDFAQKGACNVTVRFATYQVHPYETQSNYMMVKSTAANLTGAVVVQVALNGRQFDKDITINTRDVENTFYYYKFPYVTEMKPVKGTTIGGTEISLLGVGFRDPFNTMQNVEEYKLYYRFIDYFNEDVIYTTSETFTIVSNNHRAVIYSPRVFRNNTITRVELSYNNQDYKVIEDQIFSFYVLPNITNINPQFGPLISNDYDQVKVKLDNFYCVENCEEILCKYKSKSNIFLEKGAYTSPNTINCTVPRVNIPESFSLEVSFNNGEDFTNNNFNYTFYDPYVLKVEPQMVSSKGGTKIKIKGYGFANSGENLKFKFGSKLAGIKCNFNSCIKNIEFINDNEVIAETYARSEVIYEQTGEIIGYERFSVEVSVYNDDFTNNNVTIFYYDEPEIISDLFSTEVIMDAKVKEALADSIVTSLPSNADTMIPIAVDSSDILKYYKEIDTYANYTCRFQMKNDTSVFKITYGVITSFPLEANTKNVFLCQSPKWENVGQARVQISLNGFDFSSSDFSILFTDPVTVLRIEPPCGPLTGGTNVQLYGTGFENKKDYVFKWGPQNLVQMYSASFLDFVKSSDMSYNVYLQSKFTVQKINVRSPQAPFFTETVGGLDYISISKLNYLPTYTNSTKFYPNNYLHTNFEFYYYKQPYVQSFSPKGSIVTGGTNVLVVGAWFQYKPDYAVKPYCKFGTKIVEGTYLSTVRISCITPAYSQPNVRVPFCVSLNKYDFVCTKTLFTYYNDFTHASFEKMVPQSGPEVGGTQIKIFGKNFTNLVTPDEFLCQFKPDDPTIPAKNVPAGFQEFTRSNQTAIICNTPGGWSSGTKAAILITFDGQNFMPTGFNFYFYKIDYIFPRSGPNTGNGPIGIHGGGFKNSSKVKCTMDGADYKPISISEHKIQCPMPAVYNKNFTGGVDLSIMLNGIDPKNFPKGFYYYEQITIDSIYPFSGPSKGNGIVKVYGKGFRNDFPGVDLGCKIGNYHGKGEFVSEKEMNCYFKNFALLKNNSTMNFTAALNSYSFTKENENITFSPYGIIQISPSSGPITGSTRIDIKGAGFFDAKKIRCRFGVPGYYYYTNAEFISYNLIVCSSPEDFKVPIAGQLPFSVPFSIAFNDDEFQPWTESSHFFSFYDTYQIESVTPLEGNTKSTTEVSIYASFEKPFSMPSASSVEEDLIDYSYSTSGSITSKKSFNYQPISCKFGRFGATVGEYVNRTLIKCLTPNIQDDSDVGYEEVPIEIALNGVDYVVNEGVAFTFIGPNANKMLWVYVLITILTALLMIGIAALFSSYWNKIVMQMQETRNVHSGDQPHVINKQPRYLDPFLRGDPRDSVLAEPQGRRLEEENNRRNISGSIV